MAVWQTILLGVAAIIVVAVLIEMYLKRNQPRPPLAKQFLGDDYRDEDEDKPELGMEAIDMEVIRASERGSKSAAALGARDMQFWNTQLHRPRKRNRNQTHARNPRNEEKRK